MQLPWPHLIGGRYMLWNFGEKRELEYVGFQERYPEYIQLKDPVVRTVHCIICCD
jgi:hypothetical protein